MSKSQFEKLKINLETYVENDLDKYAMVLNGNWGSGKTYAIQNIIKEFKYTKDTKYISLNGYSNIDDIFSELIIKDGVLKKKY